MVNVYGNARAVLGNFVDSDFLKRQAESDRKSLLLEALYYDGMRSRKAQIEQRAGSPKSIEWIWSTTFDTWLGGSASFFWITGRPGSGKSTLMKHLADSRKTLAGLKRSGDCEWVVIHHFFDFRAAKEVPNRVDGTLRSLLHQIVRSLPEAADNLDDCFFETTSIAFSLQQCLDMLCDIIGSNTKRLIAFIDVLDEHQGSAVELIDTIFALEDRVEIKICLASRPELIFERELFKFPHLTVQDYNHESIKLYTEMALTSARYGPWVQAIQALSDRIREKANGVFLWARLAVDELVQKVGEGQSQENLSQVLDAMPAEVEGLYQRILENIPQLLRTEAAILLSFVLDKSQEAYVRDLFAALEAVARHLKLGTVRVDSLEEDDCSRRILATLGSLLDLTDSDAKYAAGNIIAASFSQKLHPVKSPLTKATLMHETLSKFLNSSNFMKDHLPDAYQKRFAPSPWLQICAQEILWVTSEAEHTHKGSKQSLGEALGELWLQMGALKECWIADGHRANEQYMNELCDVLQPLAKWTPMLATALIDLPDTFVERGIEDINVQAAVDAALNSPLAIFHTSHCFSVTWEENLGCCMHTVECESIDREDIMGCCRLSVCVTDIHCTLIAELGHKCRIFVGLISHRLYECALEILISEQPFLYSAQYYFDLLWYYSIGDHMNDDGRAQLFQYLIACGARLMGQHLCLLIRDEPGILETGKLLYVIQSFPRLSTLSSRHPFCRVEERCEDCFLTRWAEMTPLHHDHFDNNLIIHCLKFTLSWALDYRSVNSVCSTSGTVLHTLLEHYLSRSRLYVTYHLYWPDPSMLLGTLIALSYTDLDPCIAGQRGTGLQAAEYYFDVLKAHETEDEKMSAHRDVLCFAAQAARDILQHYEDHGCWPQRDQMEDAMNKVEQQWKSLLRPR